jgi:hypothetical protein
MLGIFVRICMPLAGLQEALLHVYDDEKLYFSVACKVSGNFIFGMCMQASCG